MIDFMFTYFFIPWKEPSVDVVMNGTVIIIAIIAVVLMVLIYRNNQGTEENLIYGLVAVACNIIVMGWFYWYISVPLAIVVNLVIVWVQHVDIKLRYFAQQRGLDAKKLKWVWDFESGEQYMEIYNEARDKKYLPEEMKEFALPLWPICIGAVVAFLIVALTAFFTGGYKFIPCY